MIATIGLDALAQRAREELALFDYPDKPWVTPRHGPGGEAVRDVTIVGGGQSGLAIAASLRRERITNIEVLDGGLDGQEGPWVTYARMLTLRTLKFLTGPDTGIPALTYRAWHEAQFGRQGWDSLVRVPKGEWMRYLVWLRRTLELPVRNGVRLRHVEPLDGMMGLELDTPSGPERLLTRKLVLATGMEGAGGRSVPGFVPDALPRDRWAHSAEFIDFAKLSGRRVVVVGAGASAFDNAATALEHGAARVDIFVRRPVLPETNAFRVLENTGFFHNFADMPDAERWRFMQRLLSLPMPPPQDTLDRTFRHANAHLHLGSPLLDAQPGADSIRLCTPAGWLEADFLILGTGFTVDLALRPELAAIAPHAARWQDRHPPAIEHPAVARYPYLSAGFALTEREPGTMPALRDIHLFTVGAMVSMGPISGGLNGMPWGVPRLVKALSKDLFMAELDASWAAFTSYDTADPWEAVRAPTTCRITASALDDASPAQAMNWSGRTSTSGAP